jgi:uncharacterized protein (TIGR03083 family)
VDKDPFALIATERLALADLVDGLSEPQLATQSLCGAWTVKDVAAHLMAAEEGAVSEFLVAWVRSGFSFDRANLRMTAARAGTPVSELTALMRKHAESRFTPPTMDWHAPLTDVMATARTIQSRSACRQTGRWSRGATSSTSWSPRRPGAASAYAGCPACGWSRRTSSGPTAEAPR